MGLLRRERGQRTGSKHESLNKGRNLRDAGRESERCQTGVTGRPTMVIVIPAPCRLLGSRLVVAIVRENGILPVTSARRSDGRMRRLGVHTEQLETDNNSSSAVWKSLGPSPVRRKKGKHVKGKHRSARRIRRKRAKDAALANARTETSCEFVVQKKTQVRMR